MFRSTKLNQVFVARPVRRTALAAPFVASEVPRARLLAWYLVHSCIYYGYDSNVISDTEFDQLAYTLREYWWDESIQAHPHRCLVDFEMLQRGSSGYYITFPATVWGCAQWLLKQHAQKTNHRS